MTSSRLVLPALVCAAALSVAACPHRGDGGGTGPGTGKGTGSGTGGKVTPDAGVRVAGQPLLPVDGVSCPALGCVYHAGANAYFACTSGDEGICFHYGAPCAPVDSCMFDAADGRYKTCASPAEGTCSSWGAACAPADACLFDAADGLHHHCDTVVDGACTAWGALCDPG